MTTISTGCNHDVSNASWLTVSTYTKGSGVLRTSTAVSLPTSPVSATQLNEDDNTQSSADQSTATEETEHDDCTRGNSMHKLSVRFSGVNEVFKDQDYSEKVHKYRADIWYTREEYRTFWNDRMNSVRLWKRLSDGNNLRSNGALGAYSDFIWDGEEYTARGLENYIFSSSHEMNRQRDLYTVAALQDPYNAERMLSYVRDMSIASLQRAQNYALHDAAASLKNYAIIQSRTQSNSAHVGGPSSVSPINDPRQDDRSINGINTGIPSIRELNKRLINGHVHDINCRDISTEKRKAKRRSSTSGSFIVARDSSVVHAKRRRSISFTAQNYRQPVSLQVHNVSGIGQQRQRASMTDDFNQHMKFCNRLLNGLPTIDHSTYRRDSLNLAGSFVSNMPDQIASFEGNVCYGNNNALGMDNECTLQQQMRRDSLSSLRKRLSIDNTTNIDFQIASGAFLNATHPTTGTHCDDKRSLHQISLEQKQNSLSDSALNEYTNYIRSYSRLRRDSLGGNFGL